MRRPASPTVLATAFHAFQDLHRPAYLAYASARLPHDAARTVVALLFELVAGNWLTIVAAPRPAARAWQLLTRSVGHRSGATTAAEDVVLLHDRLHLPLERIATITGSEAATVTALLAAGRRTGGHDAPHRAAARGRKALSIPGFAMTAAR